MKIIIRLIVALITSFMAAPGSQAQTTDKMKPVTYLLPDGSVLTADKLDSLNKAWGDGRVSFRHTKEDDENNIVHLVRMTDEMEEQNNREKKERMLALAGMLDKLAPDFELKDLGGKQWSLKDLRGKIVVLNFWFTSCLPCIRELPDLNRLVNLYNNRDVVFLGLTYNHAEQVSAFLEKRTFNYTLLPSSSAVDKTYNVSSWPTSIVIDKEGIIRNITGSSAHILNELSCAIDSLH